MRKDRNTYSGKLLRVLLTSFISLLFILALSSISHGQSKIGVGFYVSPALETLYEGAYVNNTYGQKFSTHFGVVSDMQINKRISATAGIVEYFRGGMMDFVDSTNFDSKNFGVSTLRANYISVPIIIDIHFFVKNRSKFRKIQVYKSNRSEVKPVLLSISGGVIAGYAIKQEMDNRIESTQVAISSNLLHEGQAKVLSGLSDFNKFYIGGTIGLKATFNFNSKISLYLRPNYTRQINRMSNSDWMEPQLYGYSCDVGVTFTIR